MTGDYPLGRALTPEEAADYAEFRAAVREGRPHRGGWLQVVTPGEVRFATPEDAAAFARICRDRQPPQPGLAWAWEDD